MNLLIALCLLTPPANPHPSKEARDLLAFFIEVTEEGSVKNWLFGFQRTFDVLGAETGGAYAN